MPLLTDTFSFNVAKGLKRSLSLHIGYPYFSEHYIRQHIVRPDTAPDELREYELNRSPQMKRFRRFLILISIIFYFRVAAMPTICFNEMNFRQLNANVHQLTPQVYKFNCLLSNCSKFDREDASLEPYSKSHIGQTLITVPYFSLCHNQLAHFYEPTHILGFIGMLIASNASFAVLLSGAILPLMQALYPNGNLFLMFIVAPAVTRRVVRDRAIRLLDDLLASYVNFERNLRSLGGEEGQDNSDNQLVPDSDCFDDKLVLILTQQQRRRRRRLDQRLGTLSGLSLGSHIDLNHALPKNRSISRGIYRENSLSYKLAGERWGGNSSWSHLSESSGDLGTQLALSRPNALDSHFLLAKLEDDDELKLNFANDCISVMRSRWWQTAASRLLATLALGMFLGCGCLPMLALFTGPLNARAEYIRSLGSSIRNLGCAIWTDHENEPNQLEPSNLIDLEHYEAPFNGLRELLLVIWTLWPFSNILLFLIIYYVTSAEMTCWLYELIFELTISLEFMRQLCATQSAQHKLEQSLARNSNGSASKRLLASPIMIDNDENGDENGDDAGDKNDDGDHDWAPPWAARMQIQLSPIEPFKLARMRAEFVKLVRFDRVLVGCDLLGCSRSRLRSALVAERLVGRSIARHQMGLQAALELLEKLYISLRIFIEHVQHYAPTMTIMTSFINAYIYGYIATYLWYIRTIDGFILWPVVLMVVSWLTTNFFILLASNFHAKAKVLHTLIWSLLAVIGDCHDLRMRHMHSLWLKQVRALDMDGGLALRAFNLRITYVRIIQIVIGGGTLIVFVMRL